MVGDDGFFRCRRSRTDNFQSAIELEGVGIDDLAVELFRHIEGKRGFSGSGGAADVIRSDDTPVVTGSCGDKSVPTP